MISRRSISRFISYKLEFVFSKVILSFEDLEGTKINKMILVALLVLWNFWRQTSRIFYSYIVRYCVIYNLSFKVFVSDEFHDF